jgi:outer membrane receptor protein involved in Fe transport
MSSKFQFNRLTLIVAGLMAGSTAWAGQQESKPASELDEVIVTATLWPTAASRLPQSVTVLESTQLQQSGLQHFGDVLALVPGLTAAGGTSRPRYFQMRGIGEQEQYQGAPNPSVGFLVDGIDFSGVGMPATLFDTQSIEVLRGPQGSAYGANALAGLINVVTRAPAEGANGHAEMNLGDYNTRSAGVALGDGDGSYGWRLAAQKFVSNGFRRDAFLQRNDTNDLDELTLRGKLHWSPGAGTAADLTLMQTNQDNGYDAWSIDNTRVTQSDKPGRDAQLSRGAALRLQIDTAYGQWESLGSVARSNIHFSYDGDWGNDAFWAATPACRPDPSQCLPYDFTSDTQRVRKTVAQDLRLHSNRSGGTPAASSWLFGVYVLRLDESNDQLDLYNGGIYQQLSSDYRATSMALYGQVVRPLGARLSVTTSLRGEQRRANYSDSDAGSFDPVNRMWGGSLSLGYERSTNDHYYAALSRGYRAGGFNIGSAIPVVRRQFRPEYLWNLEFGRKWRSDDGILRAEADVFYMRRLDEQVSSSVQTDPSDPLSFDFYTDNAARGENYGLEAELGWQLSRRWTFAGTAALLRTRYIDFAYNVVTYDSSFNPILVHRVLSGRAQEYAPAQKLSLSADYRHPLGWFAHIDAAHTSSYFFSASHDNRAAGYELVSLRAGIARGAWETSAWVRNAFNAGYALHGFYFGNEPPDFANKLYLSGGEPRQLGLTLRYRWGTDAQ